MVYANNTKSVGVVGVVGGVGVLVDIIILLLLIVVAIIRTFLSKKIISRPLMVNRIMMSVLKQ